MSQSTAQDVFDKACANLMLAMEQAGNGTRMVSRAAFDGTDYGQIYLTLQKGEQIISIEHAEEGGGWSFGRSVETQQIGWYPTEFAHTYW